MSRRRIEPPEIRFERKVDKNGPIPDYAPDLGPCWIWLGAPNQGGYGRFRLGGRDRRAHAVSYELHVGAIPDGLVLDHLCRVRLCVNPDHLEPVTRGENTLRGFNPPAENAKKTHCNRGHAYEGDNLLVGASGARFCRECNRIRATKVRDRKRAECAA